MKSHVGGITIRVYEHGWRIGEWCWVVTRQRNRNILFVGASISEAVEFCARRIGRPAAQALAAVAEARWQLSLRRKERAERKRAEQVAELGIARLAETREGVCVLTEQPPQERGA